MPSLTFHRASSFRISATQPENSNSITIELMEKAWDGKDVPTIFTIFGLPKEITNRLMLAISDERTEHIETVKEDAA